jgi:hypothetical protein
MFNDTTKEKQMKTQIFIAVRGGVVQGVRASDDCECHVVDYDNYDDDNSAGHESVEAFEQECLDGRTWAEIEKTSKGVY